MFREKLSWPSLFVAGVLLAGWSQSAWAQFDSLLKRVPPGANALVLIDVDAVHQSPLAKRERWKETYETKYMEQPLILPPEAQRLVLAAQIEPREEQLHQDWELAVMDLAEPIPMRAIAKSEGGYVDDVEGVPTAWTPSNAYFVELGPKLLGLMYPDNRQAVARWTKFGQTNDQVLVSTYLQHAAERINRDGQIVMALDLQDAIQPHRLDERLQGLEQFADKAPDVVAGVADAIRGLQGLTLAVKFGDQATGKIWIEFDRDIKVLEPFAKSLVMTALEEHGAAIEDLEKWKFAVEYNAITLEGPLSPAALRRIFSVLEIPSTKFSTVNAESVTTDGKPTLVASKQYFSSLTVLVDDLRESLVGKRTNVSLWMDRYARKIDRMPILNVDEELLAFGADVSQRFRTMSGAKKDSLVRTGVRQSQTYGNYYNYGGNDGRYAYGYYTRPSSQRIQVSTEERAKANTVKFDQFEQIENGLAEMRQKMTQKYMSEF